MNRNSTLDIARAVSMLYIIGVWHLANYTATYSMYPYGEYLKNAALGLFMFISAYLLGSRYIIRTTKDMSVFFTKRIARIFPLYMFALLLFVINGSISLRTGLCALFGLSSIVGPQPPTLWFVSLIILFYFIFPFLSGRTIKVQLLIGVLVFFGFFLTQLLTGEMIDRRFMFYFPCFVAGVIVSRFSLESIIDYRFTLPVLLIFVGFASLIHFKLYPEGLIIYYMYRILVASSGSMLILMLAKWLAKFGPITKMLTPMAYASMAAYMFHRQLISLIRHIYWPEDGILRLVFLIFFCIPLVLVFGYTVQYIYDRALKIIPKRS